MNFSPYQFSVRPAVGSDAANVTACIESAYRHYLPSIGQPPEPMLLNYAEIIAHKQVFVACVKGEIIGVLVLAVDDAQFWLDNVAIAPRVRGQGIGKALLELAEAEAKRQCYSVIYLHTNEQMTENRDLYSRIGYSEYKRGEEKGYSRIYMRKQLC